MMYRIPLLLSYIDVKIENFSILMRLTDINICTLSEIIRLISSLYQNEEKDQYILACLPVSKARTNNVLLFYNNLS